ncbi:hypothetical protein SprV_0301074900 [Sparganum proliferum]
MPEGGSSPMKKSPLCPRANSRSFPYVRPGYLDTHSKQNMKSLINIGVSNHFLRKYLNMHHNSYVSPRQLGNMRYSKTRVPNTSQSTLVERDSLSCSVTAASRERESASFVSVTAHPPLLAVPQLSARSTANHSLATSPVPPAVRSGSLYSDQEASCSLAAEELPSLVKVGSDDATTHSELRQAVEQASVDQLVRVIGPKFAQNFSLWDFLMLRCSTEEPSSALIAELVEEYLTFVKNVQPLFADCLRPVGTLECPARDQPCSLGSPQLPPSSSSDLDNDSGISAAVADDSSSSTSRHQFLDQASHLRCRGSRCNTLLESRNGLLEHQTPRSQQSCGSQRHSRNNKGFNGPPPSPTSTGPRPPSDDCFFEVENPEQAAALALPIGRYAVCPQRTPVRGGGDGPSVSDSLSRVAGRTREAEGVAETTPSATILNSQGVRHAANSDSAPAVSSPSPAFVLLDEGLGRPIDDSRLANGDFLPLTSTSCADLPSDLVLEAATGRIFHRPTGRLAAPLTEADQTAGLASERDAAADPTHCVEIPRVPLYVTVETLSPTSSLVVRSDGASFKVDHGGEGVSQDAIATILQMND